MSSHYVTSQCYQELLRAILNKNGKVSGEQEKKFIICVRVVIEKSVPRDHHLLSLCKPHDASDP